MNWKHILTAALVAAVLSAVPAFAYDENTDHITTGTNAVKGVGPKAAGNALVFTGTYDFSSETYDTNDIVKLVSVPEGILVDKVVVSTKDCNYALTNTLYKYTTSWAAEDSAQTYAKTTDTTVVYHMLSPTYANTNAANVEVEITDDTIAGDLSATSWGFINTLETNGPPTAGYLTISVIGYDVHPQARED